MSVHGVRIVELVLTDELYEELDRMGQSAEMTVGELVIACAMLVVSSDCAEKKAVSEVLRAVSRATNALLPVLGKQLGLPITDGEMP
jgi:hypothetical protein